MPTRPRIGGVAVASPADLAAQHAADSAAAEALPALRSAAEKWQAAIGGILGLFAISGLIKGPADLASLDPSWRPLVAVLLAGGVALGLAATVFAARAAHGYPAGTWNVGERYIADRQEALRGAAKDLRMAIGAAILALAALSLAVGVLWFGPRASGTTYLLVTTPAGIVCGSLEASTTAGLAIADRLSGGTVTVPGEDIRVILTTKTCPAAP